MSSFNDSEWDDICRMAAALGMMPGAYLAKLGTDAANGLLLSASQSEAVDRMRDATEAANKISDSLKEAMGEPHAGQRSDIDAIVHKAATVVTRLETATLKAVRELQK
jgi:hypothetical protein